MIYSLIALWLSLATQLLQADSADIVFVGDAMQHQRQLDAARCPDGSYDYHTCFSTIEPYVAGADYAVVNLETPLGGAPYSGYPMFCTPDSYLDALIDNGFDLFLGANNHALDRRDRGVRRTIQQFEQRNVPYVGIYRNRAHRDSIIPRIIDINGFKVGFLNYTYGTNGITIQGDILVDTIDTKLIESDIDRTRKAGAELIALCIHWGEEYQLLPTRQQRKLADKLCNMDVDMVIGSHPHVIQPMEMRCDSLTGRKRLLVYSLGNFISAMRTTDTRGGAAVKVRLVRDLMGNPYIDSANYRLFFTKAPATPGHNYELVPAELPITDNSTAESQRQAFLNSALKIFNLHNINVHPDTTAINPHR